MGEEGASLTMGLVPFTMYVPGATSSRIVGNTATARSVQLNAHADIVLRFPVGAQPESVRFDYRINTRQATVRVLAYRPDIGAWDEIGEPPVDGFLDIPGPASYTGPAGDLTLRLVTDRPGQDLSFTLIRFSMDGGEAR
jgi:hypothetical protein